MTDQPPDSAREQRLQEALVACIEVRESGRAENRAALLARFPEFAAELNEFFAERSNVERFAQPLRQAPLASEAPTTGLSDGAAAAPPPGTKVGYFGDYELLEEIGRGGMGVVYKARQRSLNRIVALKMILTGQLANGDDVKRFYAEARAAGNLQHEGIVSVFEVGEYDRHHYFTMAFIEGESLAHKLTEGMLPPRQAAELVKKIAKAVSYAHTEGVIHRDLKPANILLDKHGEPRLTDFGLAKRVHGEPGALATGGLTATGQVLGTPSYMPPEQASGQRGAVGPLSDVYSLGAILYCLLTARPPFQADNPFDTLMQVVEQEPVPPRQLNAKVPRDLETICLKCLQKEPGKRYSAACGFAEDLDRFLNGQPILARPTGRLERGWKWAKRRPAAAVLTVVLACAWIPPLVTGMIFVDETNRARLEAIQSSHSYDLATQNANTAFEVADRQRKDAHAANVKARVAREEAETANAKAKASLLRADGLRLIYESETARHHNPALALLLAIEGAERVPGNLANNAMQAAMDECRELKVLQGHGKPVYVAKLNADGSKALTCGEDGTVRIWDAVTGKQLHVLPHPKVAMAWFSPDGRRALTLSLGGYTNGFYRNTGLGSISLDPEAWQSIGPIAQLWDAATGKSIKRWQPPRPAPTPTERSCQYVSAVDAAFSADSRRVITSFGLHAEGACEVRNVETGEQVVVLKGHLLPILGVAFSPDKRTVATVSVDETACLWDAETGKLLHTLKGHKGSVGKAIFRADGKRLLTLALGQYHSFRNGGAGSGGAQDDFASRVWDTETGKLVSALKWPSDDRNAFQTGAFIGHEDAYVLLVGIVRPPAVWTIAKGEPVPNLHVDSEPGHWASAVHLGPVPMAALYVGPDRTAQIGAGSSKIVFRGHDDDVLDAAFSGDGKRIITASKDGTARVWHGPLNSLSKVSGPDIWEMSMSALSPDGRRLFASQFGALEGVLLDTTSRQPIKQFDGLARQVVYTADSQKALVISRTDHDFHSPWKARLLDAGTGKVLATMNDLQGRFLTLSPDARFVALASWKPKVSYAEDGTITVWELATGKRVAELKGHITPTREVSFSPDGRRLLVVASGGSSARIWDVAASKLLGPPGDAVTSPIWMSFCGDGRHVLAKLRDQQGRERAAIVDSDTGKEKSALTYATVERGRLNDSTFGDFERSVAFSPDRRRVLIRPYPEMPCIWDVDKGGEPAVVLRGHTDEVHFSAYSGDGRSIVTGSRDRTARLWDAQTGKELMVFKMEGSVLRAVLDATGTRLVTSSGDNTIRLWDVANGQEIARLHGQVDLNQEAPNFAFTADGQRVCIPGGNGVRLWCVDILSAARLRKPRELTAAERKRYGLDGTQP